MLLAFSVSKLLVGQPGISRSVRGKKASKLASFWVGVGISFTKGHLCEDAEDPVVPPREGQAAANGVLSIKITISDRNLVKRTLDDRDCEIRQSQESDLLSVLYNNKYCHQF